MCRTALPSSRHCDRGREGEQCKETWHCDTDRGREGEQCAEQPYLVMDFLTEGGGRTVCRTALPGNGLSDKGGEGEQCAEQPYLAVDFLTEGGRENCGQNNLTWQWTF